ncbi:NIPSNAP domain containing protein [Aphelenchoides fujianensis]|nr:NIPSNAP domain containing protein [Aphelenchoides fujianensis]KAI6239297.1 NIPSNAP domain containing protein [Aphelenchoides fujianensis]
MLKSVGVLSASSPQFGRQLVVRFASSGSSQPPAGQPPAGDQKPSPLDVEKHQSQSWLSRILTGPQYNPEGVHKQSHSSMLSVSNSIYELQTHDAIHGNKEEYLKRYGTFANEIKSSTPGAEIVGSWYVLFGNQDQIVHLWRYKNGWTDVDSQIRALTANQSVKAAENDVAKLCSRRRTVLTKPFSYWGEPTEREPSHIYDLRSYVLKPGTMIEWANAWNNGITYRREHNQDVGGFFAQVGQLYMVFHIWAYPNLEARNSTRQHTWAKPGWDATVAYTVPLINRMQSKILVPTPLSKLK